MKIYMMNVQILAFLAYITYQASTEQLNLHEAHPFYNVPED